MQIPRAPKIHQLCWLNGSKRSSPENTNPGSSCRPRARGNSRNLLIHLTDILANDILVLTRLDCAKLAGQCAASTCQPPVIDGRSKNVVQVPANPGKLRKQSEQKEEKRVAGDCHNLLFVSGLRRLRQDLVNMIHCFASRGPRVRVPPRPPTFFVSRK